MTTFESAIDTTNEFIFVDEKHKLYVYKIDDNLNFDFVLILKSTNCVLEKGTLDRCDLINLSSKYSKCYLDGYFFDIFW